VHARSWLSIALAATVLLGVTAPATAEVDGPQLTLVSPRPVEAAFTDGKTAEFGVTVRNDSSSAQALDARLVLDTGTDVPAGAKDVEAALGDEKVKLTLSTVATPKKIGAHDAARLVLELRADSVPKQDVAGALVVSTPGDADVTPVTVRIAVKPKPAEVSNSRFDNARVEPATITLVVHRKFPSFLDGDSLDKHLTGGNGDGIVEGIAGAEGTTAKLSRPVRIWGDTGGPGRLLVEMPTIGPSEGTKRISVDVTEISRRGTYETTIPIDPAAKDSPTLTVKVIAGDCWVWPVIVLMLGAGVAYLIARWRDVDRPKYVLQLALTRTQALNTTNLAAVKEKNLTRPYTLTALFPPNWDCKAASKPPALQLYCKIEGTARQEDRDALATQVADLEARVTAWPGICAKADALAKATDKLKDKDLANAIRVASETLLKREDDAIPADEAATTAYATSIDDQVKAVREWVNAHALLEDAERLFKALGANAPREHDPVRWRPDLRAAESLADLERCKVVHGLCRDVHILRTLAIKHDDSHRRAITSKGTVGTTAGREATFDFIAIEATPPALPGPELTKRLTAAIGRTDMAILVGTTAVVAIAYLVGIYSDTYGSVKDYLTAFAAGAGSTFAASLKLLPWYTTYKPPKAT
jgi:hypothetical protein